MDSRHLNPLSLQFKLKSPLLPDPCLHGSSGSGLSGQALIRSGHFSPAAHTRAGHLLATIAETSSFSGLPESLGLGVVQASSAFQELQGQSAQTSSPTVKPSRPADEKRQFFQESGKGPIHVVDPGKEREANGLGPGTPRAAAQPSNVRPIIPPGFGHLFHGPGASRAGPQAEHTASNVRPVVPPGFEPLPHGPNTSRIHGLLYENASPANTQSGNMNDALVQSLVNVHLAIMEAKMKHVEKNHTTSIHNVLTVKYYARGEIEKLEESTERLMQYLTGRVEALESKERERDMLFAQIASAKEKEKKNLAAKPALLKEERVKQKPEKEKKNGVYKKALKCLGVGAVMLGGIGIACSLLKK